MEVKTFWLLVGMLGVVFSASAQHNSGTEAVHIPHGPHHLSVLLGSTHVSEEGDNFTLGVDYEYRVSSLVGLGAVIEHAYGELDATTVLAVADIHVMHGFILQVGPGFENRESENVFVARLGMLYEFELDKWTLSPQLHWDYHDGEANAVIAGIALGFAF